jgi:hypothetical protein
MSDGLGKLIGYVFGFVWFLLIICGACNVYGPDAERLLRQEGYTQVKVYGHAWFECGFADTFSSQFAAIKNGETVRGAVCGGWLKDYTVRYK